MSELSYFGHNHSHNVSYVMNNNDNCGSIIKHYKRTLKNTTGISTF